MSDSKRLTRARPAFRDWWLNNGQKFSANGLAPADAKAWRCFRDGWHAALRAQEGMVSDAAEKEELKRSISRMLVKYSVERFHRIVAERRIEELESHIHEMEITVPHSTIIGLRNELEKARAALKAKR